MSAPELSCVNLREDEPAQRGRIDIVADGPFPLPPAEDSNQRLERPCVCPLPSLADCWVRVGRGLSEHHAGATRAMHLVLTLVREQHGEQCRDAWRIVAELGQVPDP
jgi:hypothetical protein